MNAVFLVALVIVATLTTTQALSCLRCDSEELKCTPIYLQNCKGGLTTDTCGCCAVCAKVIGETCGGPWNIAGRCDCGLTCHKSEEVIQQMGEFNAYGKCIRRCDTANRYAKAVGEMCGGPWNIGGKCKCRLTCHKSKEIVQQRGDFFAYGKCMKQKSLVNLKK